MLAVAVTVDGDGATDYTSTGNIDLPSLFWLRRPPLGRKSRRKDRNPDLCYVFLLHKNKRDWTSFAYRNRI